MYENWSKPIEIIEEPTFIKRTILNKIECPEVHEFNQFLQETKGHTNGWTWDDNAVFLKYKTKYKTIDKVSEKLHKTFPDKSVEEIEEHFKWHEKYCVLRDNQKVAIQKWKTQKQSQDTNNSTEDGSSTTFKIINKKIKVPPMNPEETKAKLLAWKEEKRRREQQEALTREMNEQFYKQLEIMRFQKNSEIKEKVERWRMIKASEKQAQEAKRREEELKTRAFKYV